MVRLSENDDDKMSNPDLIFLSESNDDKRKAHRKKEIETKTEKDKDTAEERDCDGDGEEGKQSGRNSHGFER